MITDINSQHEKTRSAILEPYRLQALALVIQFDYVHIRWIPRHKNSEADALSQTTANNGDAIREIKNISLI
ncbi:reverse transcriptase-like protein [Undibacterium sp. SXout7W]|uniref:reverse transcriptase-like protein n=1 Tax=Undibacterium sp. SXout7W TaxID=3413049 RepID=UPI003BF1E7BC